MTSKTNLFQATVDDSASTPMPMWRASLRMAVVSVASLVAAGLMTSGLTGCADMSGITPQASLREAASLGLVSPPVHALAASDAGGRSAIAAEWWQDFGDEQLNRLVDQALASSPSPKLAQVRLARSQPVTEVANAAVLPQINGQLDLTRQRYTAHGAVPPLAGSIRDNGTAQLSASWELDFFGKNRAALDAALGNAQAAQADA